MAELVNETPVVTAKEKASGTPDYGMMLTWYFKDPKFGSLLLKGSLLLLSCLLLIPLFYVIPVFVGFVLDLTRNVQKGEYKLPELGTETQWKEGAILALLAFVGGMVIGFVTSAGSVSSSLLTSLQEGGSDSLTSTGYAGFMNLTQILVNVLKVFVALMVYPIFAKTRDISSLFSVSNYQTVFQNNMPYLLVATAILVAVGNVVPLLGVIALCVGILPAGVIVYIINGTFFGKVDVSKVS